MRQRRQLSIRATLWLAMALAVASSMLGTAGLQGYRLYHQAQITQKIRAQAVAETYAAQMSDLVIMGDRAALSAFLAELPWHSDSRLVAVVNSAGRMIAHRGAVQLMEDWRRDPRLPRTASLPGPRPDDAPIEFLLADAPIRPAGADSSYGTLIYAMARMPQTASVSDYLFFVYIALIAATGMLLGVFWLKRKVVDPLSMLARTNTNRMLDTSPPSLPVEREDEIGRLARVLSDMRVDLEEWRNRAARLERSIDDRVAHETDRITRELKAAQKKIWTDPLTRLGNRRLFDEKFEEIFNAQRDSGKELSLVVLDIDHFKQLNDTLGHHAGDELLKFTGELLRQCLREQDLAIRYGGDEFVLILPSVAPKQAQAIAARTLALFAQQTRSLPVSSRPSLSAGIASLDQNRPTRAEALFHMADAALYQSKNAGKGRTMIFTRNDPALAAK